VWDAHTYKCVYTYDTNRQHHTTTHTSQLLDDKKGVYTHTHTHAHTHTHTQTRAVVEVTRLLSARKSSVCYYYDIYIYILYNILYVY